MKSLFRSIRMKLLGEGKLLRYLTYAIGEILLIIIGIMLALQLNNRNEDKKAQAEFALYTTQLKEDALKGIRQLSRIKKDAERKVKRELVLLEQLKGKAILPEEKEDFEHALNGMARVPEVSLNIGYLGELLNGDKDPMVSDRELTLQTLEMTQAVNGSIQTINDKVRIIQLADETFIRYRGRHGVYLPLTLSYDLEHLRSSKEFIYAVENSIEALNMVGIQAGSAKNALSDYFFLLHSRDQTDALPKILILSGGSDVRCIDEIRMNLHRQASILTPEQIDEPEPIRGTTNGLKHIDRWLNDHGGNFDLISFNFGLQDLLRVDPETGNYSSNPNHPREAEPEVYEKQLREIVAKLKATGAHLSFRTTLPAPTDLTITGIESYNEIAINIMKENDIPVHDLHARFFDGRDRLYLPGTLVLDQNSQEYIATSIADDLREPLDLN